MSSQSRDSNDRSSAAVIVVGAGALGSPACAHLAAAGIGRLAVVDGAEVGPAGGPGLLPRADASARRAEIVTAWLGALAPSVQADPYPARLDAANAAAIVAGHDVVLDLSNDPATRAVASDVSSTARIPLVAGWLAGTVGWLATVRPPDSACLRCAEEALPEEVPGDTGPSLVRGPLAGAVGALAALAALQLLAGAGSAWIGRRLRVDGRDLSTGVEAVASAPGCQVCDRGLVEASIR
jgi:adenylyltransferase/sulfurtransferase